MKILVIDDDPRIRRILVRLLKDDYVVDVASTAEQGEIMAYDNHYDLVILELLLPDMDGEDLCTLLKNRVQNVPVIALSRKSSVSDKDYAFEKGVDDYLVKPFSNLELKARIKALLRRTSANPFAVPDILTLGDVSLDRSKKIVAYKNKRLLLRKKELTLLEFLMMNKGRVLTRGEILEHVWDSSVNPLTNTVDVHMKRLRDKIEKPFDKKYIETIHGIGYLVE